MEQGAEQMRCPCCAREFDPAYGHSCEASITDRTPMYRDRCGCCHCKAQRRTVSCSKLQGADPLPEPEKLREGLVWALSPVVSALRKVAQARLPVPAFIWDVLRKMWYRK